MKLLVGHLDHSVVSLGLVDMSAPDSEAPEVDQDGCDNERDRRKESMQKASFAFGFDTVNYRTSGGL